MTENELRFVDEILARSSGCPEAEQLEAYDSKSLDAAAHRRIEAHVSGCEPCAAALQFLASESDGPSIPEDVVRRSEGWADEARTTGAGSRWPWIAAAAAVILAVLLFLPPSEKTGAPELRTTGGETIQSLVPPDPLPRDACRLQWTAGAEGSTYRLTVFTDDLRILATFEDLRRAEHTVPAEFLERVDGDTFVWRVELFSPAAEARVSGTFAARLEEK